MSTDNPGHDNEKWDLATAKEFEPVPKFYHYILTWSWKKAEHKFLNQMLMDDARKSSGLPNFGEKGSRATIETKKALGEGQVDEAIARAAKKWREFPSFVTLSYMPTCSQFLKMCLPDPLLVVKDFGYPESLAAEGHDNEKWDLATAKEFEPVPKFYHYILTWSWKKAEHKFLNQMLMDDARKKKIKRLEAEVQEDVHSSDDLSMIIGWIESVADLQDADVCRFEGRAQGYQILERKARPRAKIETKKALEEKAKLMRP
ncbi:Hypothetical predicted protein [Olea europaea subsp. europaea]|uniref:Uncharacterized protein n=1 Tax=Olea europaea subsp. europaea TaxID=158383 RepID=A0A8S0R8E1_OLEEU|nr:Hypothetical predicted protein [Olea europaea subsp. europaea]